MRLLVVLLALLSMAGIARADIVRSSEHWKVKPDFEKGDKARTSISGAACVPGTGRCLAVNDEKRYAQFFEIDGHTMRPLADGLIRLLPDKLDGVAMEEIDAEGVAYAPPSSGAAWGRYYVVGSHGLTRKEGRYSRSAFFLFRFPVDRATGLPNFTYGEDEVAPQIRKTAVLRDVLRLQKELSLHVERQLDHCGVTVEGLAVQGDDLLFGLRAPSVGDNAFVVRVKADSLFEDEIPRATVKALRLGRGVGVRDMATVSNGILILGGRSLDSDPAKDAPAECRLQTAKPVPALWLWSGKDQDEPKPLGTLPGVDAKDKAETLLVLEETPTTYRVLVLFDGAENGGPVEFSIGK